MGNEVYKFDGNNLDYIDGSGNGYIIESLPWMNGLRVSDQIFNKGSSHGVFSSGTKSRGKYLQGRGIIKASSYYELLEFQKKIKIILGIDYTSSGEGNKELYILDNNGIEWVANARIKEVVNFENDSDGFLSSSFSFLFFISDGFFKSKQTKTISGNEEIFAGGQLPLSFPFSFDSYSSSVSLSSNGNVPAYLNITITVLNDINESLTIRNITNGQIFILENIGGLIAEAGDTIFINGTEKTVQKNGTSILNLKKVGSSWLSISGTQEFIAYDSDVSQDFNIQYSWQDLID